LVASKTICSVTSSTPSTTAFFHIASPNTDGEVKISCIEFLILPNVEDKDLLPATPLTPCLLKPSAISSNHGTIDLLINAVLV
jgi:hypothetical protein